MTTNPHSPPAPIGKPYPKWTDFPSDEVIYGIGAPHCGVGYYTLDRLYSWPDKQRATSREKADWKSWLECQGYCVPEEYQS